MRAPARRSRGSTAAGCGTRSSTAQSTGQPALLLGHALVSTPPQSRSTGPGLYWHQGASRLPLLARHSKQSPAPAPAHRALLALPYSWRRFYTDRKVPAAVGAQDVAPEAVPVAPAAQQQAAPVTTAASAAQQPARSLAAAGASGSAATDARPAPGAGLGGITASDAVNRLNQVGARVSSAQPPTPLPTHPHPHIMHILARSTAPQPLCCA